MTPKSAFPRQFPVFSLNILKFGTVFSLLSTGLHGQDVDNDDILELNEFVVTASVGEVTKQEASISITSLSMDTMEVAVPRNGPEAFRLIPGVRSEATSGDGNANISVRGLPIAAGGAKFLQLHEDGLPVLEFGDIAFATADAFLVALARAHRGKLAPLDEALALTHPGVAEVVG